MDRTVNQILADHEALNKSCIRLLPSENVMSAQARNALISDLSGRYHSQFYGGKAFILELVEHVSILAKELFHAKHAFITPISGTICVLATMFSFTKPGDKIAMVSCTGGFPFNLEFFGRNRVPLPFDDDTFNIHLQATLDAIETEKPRLVFLGTSFMLHSIPGIDKIVAAMHEHDGIVAYDGSHPLGLIAGGQFQDPLTEGVDILIGSTHKSFFGPQGGVMFTNSDEINAKLIISAGADPDAGVVLLDNPHPGRIAALGIALEEMVDHGGQYAVQVIKNARTLQSELLKTSLQEKVAGMAQGPTDSHQVYLHMADYNEGINIMKQLEIYGILCDAGVRLGTAEATRLGYVEEDMQQIGQWIGMILDPSVKKESLKRIKRGIDQLVQAHQEIVL